MNSIFPSLEAVEIHNSGYPDSFTKTAHYPAKMLRYPVVSLTLSALKMNCTVFRIYGLGLSLDMDRNVASYGLILYSKVKRG